MHKSFNFDMSTKYTETVECSICGKVEQVSFLDACDIHYCEKCLDEE